MKKLSICFYSDVFFPSVGGAQTVLHHLALECHKKGHHVVVLAPIRRADRWEPEEDDVYPYEVVRFKAPRSKKIGNRLILLDLLKVYRKHKFELLHCHAAYPQTFVARAFKRLFKVGIVCRPHGSDIVPGGGIRKSRYATRRMKLGLKSVNAFVAQCRFMAHVMVDFGIPREKIEIINNGVDVESFTKTEPYQSPRPYIISVANLIGRKGFNIMLDGLAKSGRKDIDFRIVGKGSELESLQKQARELSIEDQVIFHGTAYGEKKLALYRGSSIFVSASRKEPYSNSLLEAMAAGSPVIASAVDGSLEMVREGVNGWLFPKEDSDALASLLNKILDDKALLAKVSGTTQDYIKKHDWPLVAEVYLDLYRKVLAGEGLQ